MDKKIFLLVPSFVLIIAGCSSENGLVTSDPDIGFANTTDNNISSSFTFDVREQSIGSLEKQYSVILAGDATAFNQLNAREARLQIAGATWDVSSLPNVCQSNGADISSFSVDSVSCLFPSFTDEQGGLETSIEWIMPVFHIPYETGEIYVSLDIKDTSGTNTVYSSKANFTHVPLGSTTLDSQHPIQSEITRILSLAAGNPIARLNFRPSPRSFGNDLGQGLLACHEDIGTYTSIGSGLVLDNSYSTDIFHNCNVHGILINGNFTVTSSHITGKSSFGFSNASLTNDAGEMIQIIGEIAFDLVPDIPLNSPSIITPILRSLDGRFEMITPDGIYTQLDNYTSNCNISESSGSENLIPFQNYPNGNFDVVSFTSNFSTTDVILEGSAIDVSVNATLTNKGSIVLTSDNGSTLDVKVRPGPAPTAYIELRNDDLLEQWTVPWQSDTEFGCIYRLVNWLR